TARQTGGPVMELGCGTGRVLIPTARAGVEITGLDASRAMLGVCRRKLENEPADVRSRVHLVDGDLRDFRFPRRFKLVTIPFRPFQHLTTVDDQLSCLSSIHRALADDGRFVFDLFNPSLDALVIPVGQESEPEPEFVTADGRRVIRRYQTVNRDRFNQVNHAELIYYITHPNGRQERIVHAFPMRYIFPFEAEHLLARAGFTVEHLYADWDKSPYGSKYPGELIFVARKA